MLAFFLPIMKNMPQKLFHVFKRSINFWLNVRCKMYYSHINIRLRNEKSSRNCKHMSNVTQVLAHYRQAATLVVKYRSNHTFCNFLLKSQCHSHSAILPSVWTLRNWIQPLYYQRCRYVKWQIAYNMNIGWISSPLGSFCWGKQVAHVKTQHICMMYWQPSSAGFSYCLQVAKNYFDKITPSYNNTNIMTGISQQLATFCVHTSSVGKNRRSFSITSRCSTQAFKIARVIPPGPGPTSQTWALVKSPAALTIRRNKFPSNMKFWDKFFRAFNLYIFSISPMVGKGGNLLTADAAMSIADNYFVYRSHIAIATLAPTKSNLLGSLET